MDAAPRASHEEGLCLSLLAGAVFIRWFEWRKQLLCNGLNQPSSGPAAASNRNRHHPMNYSHEAGTASCMAAKGLCKNNFRKPPCSFDARRCCSFQWLSKPPQVRGPRRGARSRELWLDSLNMLVTRASPAAKPPSAFLGIYFCPDPKMRFVAERRVRYDRGMAFYARSFPGRPGLHRATVSRGVGGAATPGRRDVGRRP